MSGNSRLSGGGGRKSKKNGKNGKHSPQITENSLFPSSDSDSFKLVSDSSTVSPRKKMLEDTLVIRNGNEKRRRFSGDFTQNLTLLSSNLTSSPKKYIKVMNNVLPSPKSSSMKEKLLQLAREDEDRPILKPKSSLLDAWDQLFTSIQNDSSQAKLAVSKKESTTWDSLFDELDTNAPAISVNINSDEEISEEIELDVDLDLESTLVEHDKDVPTKAKTVQKIPSQKLRTYGSERSYRATVDSQENDAEVLDSSSTVADDSVTNINDLRTITVNSQLQEEIDELLLGLSVSPGNSLLINNLIELTLKLQASYYNYLNNSTTILSKLCDIRNKLNDLNAKERLIDWLILISSYYFLDNEVTSHIDIVSMIKTLNKDFEIHAQLSPIAKQNLNKLIDNLEDKKVLQLKAISCLNNHTLFKTSQTFELLSEIFEESPTELQIEILVFFERFLEESKDIWNLSILPELVSQFMDHIDRNHVDTIDLHTAKVLVIMTTKFPTNNEVRAMFCERYCNITFKAINRIYDNIIAYKSNSQEDSLAVLLLGYLLNYIESKPWKLQDYSYIYKNFKLAKCLTREEEIYHHMVGYNMLILANLSLSSEQLAIESKLQIDYLKKFKTHIHNDVISSKIDALIAQLNPTG